jgi:hypothetical protein
MSEIARKLIAENIDKRERGEEAPYLAPTAPLASMKIKPLF